MKFGFTTNLFCSISIHLASYFIDSNASCDIQAFSDTTKVSNGRTKIITQAQKDDYVNKKICFHAVLASNSNLEAYAGANIIP
ncbi:MAG: hypothetical protein OXF30_00915 [Candidatus Saccharibacteria bacterium]|nr:hypothetical protein [Candidatus Saccharibacteria bacterium]